MRRRRPVLSSAAVSTPDAEPTRARRLHPRDRRRRPPRGAARQPSSPASRRSPTATSTSATPSRSASTSASPREFGGRCHLRFDDTNPMKEEQEYIDAIEADIRWLGFDWGEHLYFASDYFEQLYEWAVELIKAGKAYVDDLSADEIREHRGTFTEPGRDSPWRDRPAEREPRPLRAHARRGVPRRRPRAAREDRHGRAQHQPARPRALPHPARRAPAHRRRLVRLSHLRLRPRAVGRDRGHHALHLHARVRGPPAALRLAHREPAGAVAAAPVRVRAPQPHAHRALQARAAAPRQRGHRARLGRPAHADDVRPCAAAASPPRASATSPRMVGVAKADNTVEVEMLEHCVRDVLNRTALRRFAVLDPLKVVIENYPEGQTEEMEVPNNPEDPSAGSAQGDLLPRALDRARRLHGGAGAQVLPPGARPRGAAALGLLRHLQRGRQGRRRRDRRAALHLRPGDARRRRARRPPPQGHPALALGRARRARRGPAVRPPLHAARTPAPTAATSSRT